MKRLREIRKAKGLTLERLAELLGVSHAIVQRWEQGKRQCPSGRIETIAKILECHPGELFARLPMGARLTETQKEAAKIAERLPAESLSHWIGIGKGLASSLPPPASGAPRLRVIENPHRHTTGASKKHPRR